MRSPGDRERPPPKKNSPEYKTPRPGNSWPSLGFLLKTLNTKAPPSTHANTADQSRDTPAGPRAPSVLQETRQDSRVSSEPSCGLRRPHVEQQRDAPRCTVHSARPTAPSGSTPVPSSSALRTRFLPWTTAASRRPFR